MIVSAQGEEDRRDLLPWAPSTATCTLRGKPVQERNSRTSTSVSEIAVWATVKTSKIWLPICQSYQCSTFLPHPCTTLPGASEKTLVWFHVPTAILWCARLRPLLKHGRTNFLGRFLSLEIGQKWGWPAKFHFLLSPLCSWESWCYHCLVKGSWGHLVPVPTWCPSLGQLRHRAGTEQQPQHFNTTMLGEGVNCLFSKVLIHSEDQNISKCPE